MRLCPQKLPYRSLWEALLPALPLPKARFLIARTLRIGRGFTEPGDGDARKVPGVACRLGAFLAAQISLFREPRGLESREMNPLRNIMNAVLQQSRLGSAAWLMTRERTRGKCNGRANLCRVPALDKIRRLTPTEETSEGLRRNSSWSCGPRARICPGLSFWALSACMPWEPAKGRKASICSYPSLRSSEGVSQLPGWSCPPIGWHIFQSCSQRLWWTGCCWAAAEVICPGKWKEAGVTAHPNPTLKNTLPTHTLQIIASLCPCVF